MECYIKRLLSSGKSTIGTFEINGFLKYYSMEPAKPIPAGRYRLVKYYSPAHKCWLALMVDVPGHSYIEIHIGNYPSDTKNCCLIAAGYLQKDFIASSKIAFDDFNKQFFSAIDRKEDCFVTITDDYKQAA